MKLGRNEVCHCGSGKKYKKCCLLKDLEQEKEQKKEQEKITKNLESEWISDEGLGDSPFVDDGIDMDDFEEESVKEEENLTFSYPSEEVKKYSGKGYIDNDYPDISKEDLKKVDDWWGMYKNMESPDVIKEHLDGFLENNPKNVIINMSLEHEVLFELVSDFLKEGKIDKIIPYMIQFREKYPEVYIRSAGYYDSYIITWLISKNRTDEIVNYLNYFEQYPINYIDKLFEIINLLLATNHAEIITPLIKKVYKAVWYSHEVIGGYEIADTLVAEINEKYLDKRNDENDIAKLTEELQALGLDFDEKFFSKTYWTNRINDMQKKYDVWDDKLPKKKNQVLNKVISISHNFSYFLVVEKGLSYPSSHYYGRLLSKYYDKLLSSEKKPKSLFLFIETQIDKFIAEITKGFLSFDYAQAISLMNMLYYFAEYLFKCGNYTEEQKNDVQNLTEKLFKEVYKRSFKTIIETSAFYRFPLFG